MGKATCTVCNADFTRATSLRRHMLLHAAPDECTEYTCDTCGSTFARADGLTRHMNIHTGNDLERCGDCGRDFGRGYLAVHYNSCRGRFSHSQKQSVSTDHVKTPQTLQWQGTYDEQVNWGPLNGALNLTKPIQFVYETARSARGVVRETECMVRGNDLHGLQHLLSSLPRQWATAEAFQRLYFDEAMKWRGLKSRQLSLAEIAAEAGALDVLKYLLSPWQELNDTPHGQPLLHQAIKNGHLDVTAFLVQQKNADSNLRIQAFEWKSPLAVAVQTGRVDVVRHLIDLGCDLQAQCDPSCEPVISLAFISRDQDIARLLIDKGAPVRAANRFGVTPLHHAAKADAVAILQAMVDSGAAIDAGSTGFPFDGYGATPLCWAAGNGKVDAMRLLLASGASVNGLPGRDYDTPLLCACMEAHRFGTSALDVLISSNVDLDRLHLDCYRRCTVLSIVCRRLWASPKVARKLVEAGASLSCGDRAPLLDAWQCTTAETFELLLKSGAEYQSLNLEQVRPLRDERLGLTSCRSMALKIPFRDHKLQILDAWRRGKASLQDG